MFFGNSLKNINAKVTIITGPEALKDKSKLLKDKDGCVFESIEIILNDIQFSRYTDANLFVMTGSKVFHDRFIILDDNVVWLSGNSLNSIGMRRSMIIRLPDPEPVLDDLRNILRNNKLIKPFSEWIENYRSQ